MSYNLCFAEVREGRFEERNLDVLGLSRLLGDQTFLLLPKTCGGVQGAERVIEVDLKEEDFLSPLCLVTVIEEVKKRHGDPTFLLFPHSSFGMDAAPYISGYFGLPLLTDLSSQSEGLFLKSFFSEKVFGGFRFICPPPFVLTVRSGAFKRFAKEEGTPEREEMKVEIGEEKRGFLGYVIEESQDVDIAKADFLLSIGRGVGTLEEIPRYELLAQKLKATLCASRPVIDKMWLPKSRQVGISGKTVKPKVYLAMGISGSFQHIQGMKDAECIIAVNRDPNAPIFQYSHFGVLEDMHRVRDILLELLGGE